MVGYCKTNSIR